MLASINPLGERSRNQRWGVTFTFYLLGSIVGGATLGGAAGLAGAFVSRGARIGPVATGLVAAGACLVALAVDLRVGGLRPVTLQRQVDENWLTPYRGWVYGLGFGFQLGLGVVTVVTTATTYLVVVLAFLTSSGWAGLAVGAAFGLVRALPLLLVARVHSPDELRRVMRRTTAQSRRAHLVTVSAVIVVALGVVAATVGGGGAWLS